MRAASISLMPCFSIRRRRCAFSWPSVMARAYPRVCGATPTIVHMLASSWGLSPRVRGNRKLRRKGVAPVGPIPACAGQPRSTAAASWPRRAYPRVCGATQKQTRRGVRGVGLSPRVRGNRPSGFNIISITGPIPACAGQPSCATSSPLKAGAYPRVCGATDPEAAGAVDCLGLSPRVRGNLRLLLLQALWLGPIPACAGQPLFLCASLGLSRAYPRVCGATSSSPTAIWKVKGLSPRVRGNLLARPHRCAMLGPIPACAGQPATCLR